MSLFDFYIMVDWSGAARRRGMRADAIRIAYGDIEAEKPKTASPFFRGLKQPNSPFEQCLIECCGFRSNN